MASDTTGMSSRLRDTRRLVLDEAARQRRHRKALEALEADNFQPDPHADLRLSKLAPKFDDTFGTREVLRQASPALEAAATVNTAASASAAAAAAVAAKKSRRAKSTAGVLARGGGRVRKNFAALLEEEHARFLAAGGASASREAPYELAQVGPSRLPPRRFCAVCGHLGPHTCVLCGARFCSAVCYATHQDTRCLKWTA